MHHIVMKSNNILMSTTSTKSIDWTIEIENFISIIDQGKPFNLLILSTNSYNQGEDGAGGEDEGIYRRDH